MTYKNVPNWHRDFTRVAPGCPMVMVGNKVDVKDRAVKAKTITFHRKKNLQYFELSAKSNYNIEKPFLNLIRQVSNNHSAVFVEYAVNPPPIDATPLDPAMLAEYERQLVIAASVQLPPDEDEDF